MTNTCLKLDEIMSGCMNGCMHAWMHAWMHACIHARIHANISNFLTLVVGTKDQNFNVSFLVF